MTGEKDTQLRRLRRLLRYQRDYAGYTALVFRWEGGSTNRELLVGIHFRCVDDPIVIQVLVRLGD